MSEEQLTEVREAHRIDEGKLATYLTKTINGFSENMSVKQFEGGQSNPTYLLESAGKRYVLRKKPPGKLLASAHMVEREYRIMHALKDSPFPVPHMQLLCEDPDIIGTTFFVMDYVDGRLIKDPTLKGFSNDEQREIYLEMNRVLAALHDIKPEDYQLEDYGKPGNYFERQIGRWTKQYLAAKTDEIESMENLMKWLPENIPSDDSSGIVHGDYLLNNMMFDKQENKILAVFDWELSTLGHPLADLSYNCMPYYLNTSGPALKDLSDSGIPSEQEYLEQYCKLTGRAGIENWNFYLAFSFFRFASIIQGVYKRGLDGNASSESATTLGAFAASVGNIAWERAES
jgi:aminoglycoside phosphotransferase (APT) family kinase protein